MSEWWTYRISDFLMFSSRTYQRLFEQYNRDLWPLHLVALLIGIIILALLWTAATPVAAFTPARVKAVALPPQSKRPGPRIIAALLAVAWLWVAWSFFWQRYSTIHTFAKWFAAAFVLEALLLASLWTAAAKPPLSLWIFALILFLYPLLSARREVFAIAPDPTALGTIALAAGDKRRWLLLPIPVLWCLVSGATLLAISGR